MWSDMGLRGFKRYLLDGASSIVSTASWTTALDVVRCHDVLAQCGVICILVRP